MLGMSRIRFLLAGAALLVTTAGQVQAGIIQYTISVNVTAADGAPGTFVQWDFSSIPSVFTGTFEADDTVTGSISHFELTVGGIDIATSHPDTLGSGNNLFDPSSLLLDWGGYNTFGDSFVGFGDLADPTLPTSSPANYVGAIEATDLFPDDPFYQYAQNWVGTYSIVPSASAVPEPSSFAIFSGLGLVACRIRRRQRGSR
ncbi:PEP-CTERM sorting domain-containing protein [Stieleria sp. TO1_6]|uniref:PEP-CTERM sorting domain-containing protein n=1 Tax=Stieleria tagensis TaxID=2956795 RepID=UPI00209A6C3F|nr:PEP-CTERM sorting domain-containing protein [Stieleria tagensis]MCO8124875.1 PEP-CTERM sorting domain-containing protein [Stieleria tagensis]